MRSLLAGVEGRLFGLIYLLSIGIDATFRPAIQALAEIPAEGGRAIQEARSRSTMDRSIARAALGSRMVYVPGP